MDPQQGAGLPKLWDEPVDRFGDFGQLFDLPGVMIDNALRGRVFDAGLIPSQMSPEDRASVADRLKREVGDFPLSNAIIEVALNPWVWVGVVMSGAFKLPPVGKMFNPADEFLSTVRSKGYMLTKLGWSTATSEFVGTDMLPLLRRIEQDTREFWNTTTGVQRSRDVLQKNLGLRNLREDRQLVAAIQAKLHGLDVEHTERRVRSVGKGSKARLEVTEVAREKLIDGARLDSYIASKGATEYVEELRKFYQDSWQWLFGADGRPDVVDVEKVQRIYRSQKSSVTGKAEDFSDGAVASLFGEDVASAMSAGKITEDTFRQMVSSAFERQQFYAPLQKTAMYHNSPGRGTVKVTMDKAAQIRKRLMSSGTDPKRAQIIEPRVQVQRLFDPEDLLLLRDFKAGRGPDSAFERAFRASRAVQSSKMGEPDALWGMVGLDSDRVFERYVREAARTWSMHAKPVADDLWEEVAASRESMRRGVAKIQAEDAAKGRTKTRTPGLSQGTWATGESVVDLPTGTPDGGWSAMDLLRGSYQTINDDHSRRHISEVYLPTITGRRTLDEGLLTGAMNKAKEMTEALVQKGAFAGAAMEEAGLGRLRSAMEKWAREPLDTPMVVDRGVASYFYGSTLGVNPGTVAINMTQPLLTTARAVELPYLVPAYSDAMRGVFKYGRSRLQHVAQHGFGRRGLLLGAEHADEKARMVREAFGEMAELVDIGPQFDEIVESMANPQLRSGRVGPMGRLEDALEFVLKGFEKGEWINRTVTGYAVKRRAAAQGITDPRVVRREIQNATELTQFVSEPLNTPAIFLDPDSSVRFLTNPLFRQFLTFPSRTLTGLAEGMRQERGLGAFRDLTRATALSAATYEVGKELFGVDLSAATIAGATLGVARDSGPFAPMPAPPIATLGGSVFMALMEQDLEHLRYTLPTLLPGGVASARAIGVLPEIPMLNKLPIQRTTVDWSRPTEDGRYPVFNPEGRLISYETPTALLARSAGLDFGRFRDEGEMIRYLSNIREQTIQTEREYLQARMQGNHERADSIARDYERRYGLRLDISGAQADAFRNSKVVSRIERTMQSLPKEIRDKAAPFIEQTMGPRLGIQPGTFTQGSTIKERDPYRTASVPPQFLQELNRRVEERKAQQRGSDNPFVPFTPFGTTPPQ